jgi:hypothetical protein
MSAHCNIDVTIGPVSILYTVEYGIRSAQGTVLLFLVARKPDDVTRCRIDVLILSSNRHPS